MAEWIKQYRKFLLIPAALVIVLVLWKVPHWQARCYRAGFNDTDVNALEPKDRVQLQKDLINAENNARATLAQIVGGGALLVGLYFTWRNIKIGQQNVKLMEEGKLTERFSKGVEMLGSEKLDIRLGGIYALERIARDSLRDHWSVMEVLTAFVREHSWELSSTEPTREGKASSQDPGAATEPRRPLRQRAVRTDIQAILTVIARRKWVSEETERQQLDLRLTFLEKAVVPGASLCRALLSGARLERADLSGANLSGAKLVEARLSGARMKGSNLSGADLWRVQLMNAKLEGGNLRDAFLVDAHLNAADLTGADLSHADAWRAKFGGAKLKGARLQAADLAAADFKEADITQLGGELRVTDFSEVDLYGANLDGADLRGVNLESSQGLTWQQLSVAKVDESTVLPADLKERWQRERVQKKQGGQQEPNEEIGD